MLALIYSSRERLQRGAKVAAQSARDGVKTKKLAPLSLAAKCYKSVSKRLIYGIARRGAVCTSALFLSVTFRPFVTYFNL